IHLDEALQELGGMVAAARLVAERGAGAIDLVGRVLPALLDLREPREREMPVLPRFGLVENDALTVLHELLRVVVALRERDLREEQPRLEIPPRFLEPLEDLRGDRSMRAAGGEVVRVDRDEREETLARCLAARVHQLAERCTGRQR